jgi:hypothetical protein
VGANDCSGVTSFACVGAFQRTSTCRGCATTTAGGSKSAGGPANDRAGTSTAGGDAANGCDGPAISRVGATIDVGTTSWRVARPSGAGGSTGDITAGGCTGTTTCGFGAIGRVGSSWRGGALGVEGGVTRTAGDGVACSARPTRTGLVTAANEGTVGGAESEGGDSSVGVLGAGTTGGGNTTGLFRSACLTAAAFGASLPLPVAAVIADAAWSGHSCDSSGRSRSSSPCRSTC